MRSTERGAVSIFIVVFASLLITIVTISFLRLMTQTAQEASTVDLSQSAYDAALDGVEDAKRAIADPDITIDSSDGCTQVAQALGKGDNEVIIEQNEDDASLSQAYTCVTVDFDAKNVEEQNINENSSILIPLKTKSGDDFDTIRVGWRRPSGPHGTPAVLRSTAQLDSLPQRSSWGGETPALLRVRYIWATSESNIDLDDYASVSSDGSFQRAEKSRTKFIVPSDTGLTSSAINNEADNDSDPSVAFCTSALSSAASMAGYDCAFNLTNVPAGSSNNAPKFIQITPLYKGADVSIELLDGTTNVPFNGVQAIVDSTGRAGDVFRRVQARVRLDGVDTSASYPSDALVIGGGDLCKDFSITDDPDEYTPNCTP